MYFTLAQNLGLVERGVCVGLARNSGKIKNYTLEGEFSILISFFEDS